MTCGSLPLGVGSGWLVWLARHVAHLSGAHRAGTYAATRAPTHLHRALTTWSPGALRFRSPAKGERSHQDRNAGAHPAGRLATSYSDKQPIRRRWDPRYPPSVMKEQKGGHERTPAARWGNGA